MYNMYVGGVFRGFYLRMSVCGLGIHACTQHMYACLCINICNNV